MSMSRTVVPPIKCQGIKTKLVPWIKAIIPPDSNGRWIEPFMGSGVVAFNIRPRRALLADSNPHLIRFYRAIADGEITASRTRAFLENEGAELLRSEGEHYYVIRERFNNHSAPLDFLFLNRSCFNGMIRFNRKGGFNVPFCRKPNRFSKAYITKISNQVKAVSDICALGDFEFRCQDFTTTIADADKCDLLYCDPPYIGRHVDYFNSWSEEHERTLAYLLSSIDVRFILSSWHSNEYRANSFIETIWGDYHIATREHYYHLGAKEENRNSMLEALITNFDPSYQEEPSEKFGQLRLLEVHSKYSI